ncbi:nicotinate-nucleotide adenylyltransferase [Spiroplasma chrysopicola]|uniref:Probable nicotinate-nucleotide adenylyltransferase n=1 Tax=Spiroplasma chrysopicola DF-1 TaxID=1276227 RepID=R4U3L1_9MOLU|nr:nicotinate-nucleotide adenylyltransferase [Spiroplasma chrysopicola]AGM25093.1 nicotinic acid mononucleotide adenylyltransferase [Spiroplasma chrysopicola DF-1]
MKVALFGGSFDPFHTDHLQIIKLVKRTLPVNEIWIIPTNQNPFKTRKLSPIADRLAMINLAVSDIPYVKINNIELKNNQPSTTYETVVELKASYPDIEFYFIIGSDQLPKLGEWNNINELIKIQTFIILQRLEEVSPKLLQKYQAITIPFINNNFLAATDLRAGKNLALQIPVINDYINEHLLYLPERLKSQMDEKRYQHCLNVGQTAQHLANIYDLNPQQALIAGTWHDVTKQWSNEKQEAYLLKYAPELVSEPIPTWHGYSAYYYLKHELLFNDEEILSAIKWHTVGHQSMTKLEMVTFIADKISKERQYDGVEYYRELSTINLEKTFQELIIMQYQCAVAKHGLLAIGKNIIKTISKWGKS